EGQGYHVFNSLGWERNEVVYIDVNEEHQHFVAFDQDGERLDSDILQDGASVGKVTLAVSVKRIPAFGYTTIWLRASELADTESKRHPVKLDNVWDTQHYRLEFNAEGEIISWYDKFAARELILTGEK